MDEIKTNGKCCGSCSRFIDEDSEGYGFCTKICRETKCWHGTDCEDYSSREEQPQQIKNPCMFCARSYFTEDKDGTEHAMCELYDREISNGDSCENFIDCDSGNIENRQPTTLKRLTAEMQLLIKDRPELAKLIGTQSRKSAADILEDDNRESMLKSQLDNYAVMFCVGASWAITQNLRQ